jgi:hypothetical protein
MLGVATQRRAWRPGGRRPGHLATALYVTIDDLLQQAPHLAHGDHGWASRPSSATPSWSPWRSCRPCWALPPTAAADLGVRLGLTLQAVVYLYAPEAVLVRRLLGRAGQDARGDDTAAVIRHRLDVFTTTTSPLIAYYRDRGILLSVDADQPPEAVTTEILTRLSDYSPIRGTI